MTVISGESAQLIKNLRNLFILLLLYNLQAKKSCSEGHICSSVWPSFLICNLKNTGLTLITFHMSIMLLGATLIHILNFQRSVTATWRARELLKWEQHPLHRNAVILVASLTMSTAVTIVRTGTSAIARTNVRAGRNVRRHQM